MDNKDLLLLSYLKQLEQAYENLTLTQTQCTALTEENRKLKAELESLRKPTVQESNKLMMTGSLKTYDPPFMPVPGWRAESMDAVIDGASKFRIK